MSDSGAGIPSEAALSHGLRDAVIAIHRSGNEDDLTVKRVRARAELHLDLPTGFFKSEAWKQKSNDLIREAVEKYCGDDPAPPTPKPAKAPPKKRKAAATPKKPQKKRRKTDTSDESGHDQPSETESKLPKKAVRRQKKVVESDSDIDMQVDAPQEQDRVDKDGESERKRSLPPGMDAASDSELSSLIDESPVKKRRKKEPVEKNSKTKSKSTKPSRPKAAPKAKADENPDQAEIKRLQSWLVKCGIRKVWGKELANCDTAKDKIRHLKGILKEAGMDGKYSNEKAAQIKERREFAKDLEEIQAGALAWGDAGKTDTGRPRRSAARAKPAPKPVVLSDDEDDDEAQGGKDATDDDDDDDDEDEDVKAESTEDDEGDAEDTDSE